LERRQRAYSPRKVTGPSARAQPEKLAALSQAGIEVVEGDLKVPASLDAAVRDVSCVIVVSLAIPNQEPNVVNSAVRAGLTTS
jgi:uncharacterized protein YbjT (DUF2867 family)